MQKTKPAVKQGRKAAGLTETAGLPSTMVIRSFCFHQTIDIYHGTRMDQKHLHKDSDTHDPILGSPSAILPTHDARISIELEKGELKGSCTMKVMMDDLLICRFKHHNPDGIAVCVRKAAEAVELSEWAEKVLRDDAKGG